jgi:DNA polymerase III sliding clamp (beta) subunit (PCNA family)
MAYVENFTFAFKGSSLIEILKHLSGEEITISTRGETYGCVFNQSSIGNDAVSYLLMPMLCCD